MLTPFKPPYSAEELKEAADKLDRTKLSGPRLLQYDKELNKRFPVAATVDEMVAKHFKLAHKEFKRSPDKQKLTQQFFEEYFGVERQIIMRVFQVTDLEACAILVDKYASLLKGN